MSVLLSRSLLDSLAPQPIPAPDVTPRPQLGGGTQSPYDLSGAQDDAPNADPWQPSTSGMLAAGNIDLSNRPRVNNPDGSISTVRSISVDQDGRTYLLPTVVGNRVVSNDEAIANWRNTGQNLGTFGDQQSADSYANWLHNQQAASLQGAPQSPYGALYDEGYQPATGGYSSAAGSPDPFSAGPVEDFSNAFNAQRILGTPLTDRAGIDTSSLPWWLQAGVRGATTPLSFMGGGGGAEGLLTAAGAGAGQFIGSEGADRALPESTPPWLRSGVNTASGIAGALVGGSAANGIYRGAGAFDSAIAPRSAAPEYGRTPESDSLFTAGPNGEVVGPTGNVAELRLGREPVMGEDVNAGLRRTAYGRAQQDALATEEQAAFRDAGERAISGAVPDETLPPLGGGSAERPQFTIDDLNAVIAEKKAAGLTPEQILADPQVQAYQREIFKLDAPTDFNAPENLGGGQGLSAEQQANVESTVQRAGQLNTITDALAAAREPSALDSVIARNADTLPEPNRTQPPTGYLDRFRQPPAGGADIPGSQQPLVPRGGSRAPRQSRPTSQDITTGDTRGSLERDAATLAAEEARLQAIRDETARARDAAARANGGYSGEFNTQTGLGNPSADRAAAEAYGRSMEGQPVRPGADYPYTTFPGPKFGSVEADYQQGARPSLSGAGRISEAGAQPGMFDIPELKDSALRTAASWLGRNAVDVASVPRSAMAAGDVSGSLRQAGYLGPRHYREWADSFGKQMQALISGSSADEIRANMESAPLAGYRPTTLALWPKDGAGIGAREEQFASKLVKNFPGIKQTERAYETLVYTYRASLFDSFVRGLAPEARTPARLETYAKYVNAATGRGNLPQWLQAYAPALNAALFSPRFAWSIPERTAYMFNRDPAIRSEAIKDALAFYGTGLGILGSLTVAKQTGLLPNVDVNLTDYNASDWGKGHIGPLKFDIWGGNQQFVRAVARTIDWSAQEAAQVAGRTPKPGDNPVAVWSQYLRYKGSPALNLEEWARTGGQNAIGQQVSARETAIRSLVPLAVQDFNDAYHAGGAGAGAAAGVASALGLGVQPDSPSALARQGGYKNLTPDDQLQAITAQTWQGLSAHPDLPKNLQALVQQYPSHYAWESALRDHYVKAYAEQGLTQANAQAMADRAVLQHPLQKAYSALKNGYEDRWVRANPQLAEQVLEEDAGKQPNERRLSVTNEQRNFIQQAIGGKR